MSYTGLLMDLSVFQQVTLGSRACPSHTWLQCPLPSKFLVGTQYLLIRKMPCWIWFFLSIDDLPLVISYLDWAQATRHIKAQTICCGLSNLSILQIYFFQNRFPYYICLCAGGFGSFGNSGGFSSFGGKPPSELFTQMRRWYSVNNAAESALSNQNPKSRAKVYLILQQWSNFWRGFHQMSVWHVTVFMDCQW